MTNRNAGRKAGDSPAAISVAIATFNRAALVRRAIECALTQSRPPAEVIVSDDASIGMARGGSRE